MIDHSEISLAAARVLAKRSHAEARLIVSQLRPDVVVEICHGFVACEAAAKSYQWQPIETAPTKEDVPFLVMTPGNGVARFLILQVTRFQGALYPDHKDGTVGYDDAVTNATHWMPAQEVTA
ncbi:hypothetical protein [Reyranella sp.]|uniref:hypothetical protein n=1 Tax=Reyranella sp. TaxID=1929291 RepID=UPI0040369F12